MDSQSAKTTGVGGEARGYDGGKKVRGRKRHLLVDTETEGLVLKAKVYSAKVPLLVYRGPRESVDMLSMIMFLLKNTAFCWWAMLGSNQQPLPCEGRGVGS